MAKQTNAAEPQATAAVAPVKKRAPHNVTFRWRKTPPEWGMFKPDRIVEHDQNGRPTVKYICPQLDDCVLMELDTSYTVWENDEPVLVTPPPKTVFIPKAQVEAKKKRGYVVVTDAPHWSFYGKVLEQQR